MAILIDILNQVDEITKNFVFSGYQTLVAAYQTTIVGMVIIAIALFGWAVTNGWITLSINEISKRVLIIGFVLALALHWANFSEFIYNLFTNGPNDIVSHLLQAMPGSPYTSKVSVNDALQKVFNDGITIGCATWDIGARFNPLPYLYAIVIFIITVIFAGIALVELVLAKFGMAIYLVLAPIMIPLFLFKATKEAIFNGWLRHLIGFALVPIFIVTTLALVLTLLNKTVGDLTVAVQQKNICIQVLIPYALGVVVGFCLLMKASNMATSLAGGISASLAKDAANMAKTAASFVMPVAGKAARAADKFLFTPRKYREENHAINDN